MNYRSWRKLRRKLVALPKCSFRRESRKQRLEYKKAKFAPETSQCSLSPLLHQQFQRFVLFEFSFPVQNRTEQSTKMKRFSLLFFLSVLLIGVFVVSTVSAENCYWLDCHAHSANSWCPPGRNLNLFYTFEDCCNWKRIFSFSRNANTNVVTLPSLVHIPRQERAMLHWLGPRCSRQNSDFGHLLCTGSRPGQSSTYCIETRKKIPFAWEDKGILPWSLRTPDLVSATVQWNIP